MDFSRHTYQKRFLSWNDAVDYVQDLIEEYEGKGYWVREQKVFMSGGLCIGRISFEQEQGDLFDGQ